MQTKPFFDIGIIAHNEEKNICPLIDALLMQAEDTELPFNITVVASGCKDATADIVNSYKNRDNRINLLIERQRNGKASAINRFLSQVNGEIVVISSADIIPAEGTLNKLLEAFFDPSVGMAGLRIIPRASFGLTGLLNSLLWELHHEVALQRPKLGEFIAVRNVINIIPEEASADEATLEAVITQKGFKIKYLPGLIIYNYSPKSLMAFIQKRIRIFVGHLHVKETMSYSVSTCNVFLIASAVIGKIKKDKSKTLYILLLVFLEVFARATAFFEYYVRKKTYHIWNRN